MECCPGEEPPELAFVVRPGIAIAGLAPCPLPNWCERIRNSRRSYCGSVPTVPRCASLSDSALRLPARGAQSVVMRRAI